MNLTTTNKGPRTWAPALLEREENLATTAGETWAFFALKPTYIADLDGHGMDRLIRDASDRVAEQAGTDVWLRVTSIPFPCAAYADSLTTPIGDRLVDETPGAVSRDDIVDSAAWFPVDAVVETDPVSGAPARRLDSRWPVAVIGVRVASERLERCDLRRVLTDTPEPANRGAVRPIRERYWDIVRAVARAGWAAQPVDNDAFAWLFDASIALGHDVEPQEPGGPSPLADANVRTVQDPDGVTVPVRVERDGDVEVRHARILRLAQWHDRDTNVLPAWIDWCLRQPYRVDVAVRFTVKSPDASTADIRRAVHRNEGIARHMETYRRPFSDRLRAALRRGPELLDELESGVEADSVQIDARAVFAVSGATAREAVDLAKRFKADAARGKGDTDDRGPGLVLESVPAQWAEWRKFVPCEPWDLHGHQQRQGTAFIGSAVPNAVARAGDHTGVPFGAIADSSDFYLFDFFGGVRRDKAGVWGVLGDQGSGKSSMLAVAAWWIALVDRAPVSALDPSGRLAAQLRVPELQRHTREFRLDPESGRKGVLASHFLIPDPVRAVYATEGEWEQAMDAAAVERIEAAIDAAKAAMPSPQMAADAEVVGVLREAITDVGGVYGTQPSDVIAAVEVHSQMGARLAKLLRAYAGMSGGRLLWQDRASDDAGFDADALVTLVSVPGVKSPSSPDPSTWDTAEARSVVLLSAAARLASAHIWRDTAPKAFLVDEATNLLSGANAFQALVQRGALDSRKFSCSFGMAMHLSDTLASVGAHASSLFGAAFLMRTATENAAAGLPLLRAKAGHGWEDLAPTLDNGEMVASGWDDRVVRTRMDQAWLPEEFRRQLSTSTLSRADGLRTLFGVQS